MLTKFIEKVESRHAKMKERLTNKMEAGQAKTKAGIVAVQAKAPTSQEGMGERLAEQMTVSLTRVKEVISATIGDVRAAWIVIIKSEGKDKFKDGQRERQDHNRWKVKQKNSNGDKIK